MSDGEGGRQGSGGSMTIGGLTRRAVIGLIGLGGAALALFTLRGARRAESAMPAEGPAISPPDGMRGLSCIASPAQTEGPYFLDTRLNRSDIRSDPSDGTVREGVPLRLRLTVNRVDGGECTPVSGALVDIWQCDALGVYSGVNDFQGLFDTRGRQFLRGHQLTNSDGLVEFTTIYPGWYRGRAVHIHFKVRLEPGSQRGHEFTSQLYFDDAVTDEVHTRAPYNSKGRRDRRNEDDRIFSGPSADRSVARNNGKLLMPDLARDGDGYVGDFSIGLRLA